MSNSKLVNYTKISPNKNSPRNHEIDTISIHCMAGNLSVETCGNLFADSSRDASSNYGIGTDGRIALYVDEADRSWCTSSASNDNRAITIEVANDGGADTGWHVSDKAYESLISLLVDICQRNNIGKLLWKGDKSLIGQVDKQNMTVHRWFAAKACPGDYLYNLHGQIAEEVNKKLSNSTTSKKTTSTTSKKTSSSSSKTATYKVQCGAFSKKANAEALATKIQKSGFDTTIVAVNKLYKVQCGAFSKKTNAESLVKKLKAKGYEAVIISSSSTSTSSTSVSKTIKVGNTVKINKGAKTYTGGSLASFVYGRKYKVKELSGDRAVLAYNGTIVAALNTKDLTLA